MKKNENLQLVLIAFGITSPISVLIHLANSAILKKLRFNVNIWRTSILG